MTIGDVKSFMRARLFAHRMKEDHDTIFSQGRDAGVPHNSGNGRAPLRLGQSIIFDVFPMMQSGYVHDLTRTWSLGYATDEVLQAYEQPDLDRVLASLAVGQPCKDSQIMVCEYYESKGHKTPLNTPGTEEGYVHSLGHGIGLDVHEEPPSATPPATPPCSNQAMSSASNQGSLSDRGFGVRIEDSVASDELAYWCNLSDYPYDLIVPMKK